MDARARTETITELVSGPLAGVGVVVDDVTVQQAGRRRLVRVFVARDVSGLPPEDTSSPVEPLSLDEVADATRAVSDALDSSDVMGESAYTLEVSSPGLDRPLLTRDQFRRNVGRMLAVVPAEGHEPVTGRLLAVDADGVTLDTGPADAGPTDIPWDHLARATVQVEFSRPERKDH